MSKVHKCQICDKEISQDDVNFVLQASEMKLQNLTCEEHRPYGKAVQIWKVREMLGLPYVKPMAKCEICLENIPEEELDMVGIRDEHIVCEKHEEWRYSSKLTFYIRRQLGLQGEIRRKLQIPSHGPMHITRERQNTVGISPFLPQINKNVLMAAAVVAIGHYLFKNMR